jgi:hypothetical protein
MSGAHDRDEENEVRSWREHSAGDVPPPAAGLYQGLSLWQIVVILIAMAAGIWPFVAVGLWIVRGYARTGGASD